MIDETVLYHLNHRMMTALISPDVIESKPHPAIFEHIQE
jgi:beta-phosphoglucomutase-like phosphatase (HAD superfamily)